jgi:hypothetical protein
MYVFGKRLIKLGLYCGRDLRAWLFAICVYVFVRVIVRDLCLCIWVRGLFAICVYVFGFTICGRDWVYIWVYDWVYDFCSRFLFAISVRDWYFQRIAAIDTFKGWPRLILSKDGRDYDDEIILFGVVFLWLSVYWRKLMFEGTNIWN